MAKEEELLPVTILTASLNGSIIGVLALSENQRENGTCPQCSK